MMLASHSEFGLNFDILGSNVINIVLIVVLLIYLGRGLISNILTERKAAILAAIGDAESRQQQALEQLAEQQEKLAQAQQEAERIKQRAEENAKTLREQIALKAEDDIVKLQAAAEREMASERERVATLLRRQIARQALERVEAELPSRLSDDAQSRLIENSIQLLGGR